jgi:hypothetical protein
MFRRVVFVLTTQLLRLFVPAEHSADAVVTQAPAAAEQVPLQQGTAVRHVNTSQLGSL